MQYLVSRPRSYHQLKIATYNIKKIGRTVEICVKHCQQHSDVLVRHSASAAANWISWRSSASWASSAAVNNRPCLFSVNLCGSVLGRAVAKHARITTSKREDASEVDGDLAMIYRNEWDAGKRGFFLVVGSSRIGNVIRCGWMEDRATSLIYSLQPDLITQHDVSSITINTAAARGLLNHPPASNGHSKKLSLHKNL